MEVKKNNSSVCCVAGNPLPPSCSQHSASGAAVAEADCGYGATRDSCGNTVCLKGPAEMCGGKFGR